MRLPDGRLLETEVENARAGDAVFRHLRVIDPIEGSITGNSATADAALRLATPRLINGVPFDGTADITVTAAAATLTGNTLASNVLYSSLTTVGTITSGTWHGSPIDLGAYVTGVLPVSHGGTGRSSWTSYGVVTADGAGALVNDAVFGYVAASAAVSLNASLNGSVQIAAGNTRTSGTSIAGFAATGGNSLVQAFLLADGYGNSVFADSAAGVGSTTSPLWFVASNSPRGFVTSTKWNLKGAVGIDTVTAPSAWLHLPPGTTAAGTAPLKLSSSALMTVPELLALETDNVDLFWTPGTEAVRRRLITTADGVVTGTGSANLVAAWTGTSTLGSLASANYGVVATNGSGVPSVTAAPVIGTGITLGKAGVNGGLLAFTNAGNANLTQFGSPSGAAAQTYTLPVAAPAADGYVLSSTMAGVWSWIAPAAGGISGSGVIHQLAVWSSASALTGVAVGATGTLLAGVTGADPAFSASPSLTTSLTVPTIYGGTAAASSLSLVSTSNAAASGDAIYFKGGNSGGTTWATVNATGLGVGTAPSYKLHVSDSTTAGRAFHAYQNGNGAGNTYAIVGIAVGVATTTYGGWFYAVSTSTTNVGGRFYASGGTNNYGLIVAAGRVGIGTESPAVPVDIYTASATVHIGNTDIANYSKLGFGVGGYYNRAEIYYQGYNNTNNGRQDGLILCTLGVIDLLPGQTQTMRLTAAGKVTIGSTTATSLFNVGTAAQFQVSSAGAIAAATGIASSGTINFSGLTASKGVFTDVSKNLTSTGTLGVDQGGTGTSAAYSSGCVIFAGASGVYTANSAKLYWDNTNSRLGVGTGAPDYTLHVRGGTEAVVYVQGYPATANASLYLEGRSGIEGGGVIAYPHQLKVTGSTGLLEFKANGSAWMDVSSGGATIHLPLMAASTGLYLGAASLLTAGTLPVTVGGTGLASWTANGIVYASGTTTLTNGSALTWDGSLHSVTGRGYYAGNVAGSFALAIGSSGDRASGRVLGLQVQDMYSLTLAAYSGGYGNAHIFHNAYITYNASGSDGVYRGIQGDANFGSRGITFSGSFSTEGIRFYADTATLTPGNSYTPTQRMIIQNDGKVGIGMAPTNFLDVSGAGRCNSGASFSAINTGWAFSAGYSTGDWGVRMGADGGKGIIQVAQSTTAYDLSLQLYGGKVGIGVAPSYTLDVNGDVQHRARVLDTMGNVITLASGTATCTLGTDGSSFTLTDNAAGASTVSLITATGWSHGTRVSLILYTPNAKGITLKHNQSASGANKPIILDGGADLVVTGTHTATLWLEYDSNNGWWIQVGKAATW